METYTSTIDFININFIVLELLKLTQICKDDLQYDKNKSTKFNDIWNCVSQNVIGKLKQCHVKGVGEC